MSCYRCEECGELYDDDENVGHQNPTDDGLVCEDCFTELEHDTCEPERKPDARVNGLSFDQWFESWPDAD